MFDCSLHQSNSELTVIPLPFPVPSIGNLVGAGLTYTPSAYSNTIIRCTDVNTDSTSTFYHSYEVTPSGGNNDRLWNANGTLVHVIDAASGSTVVIGFDPATSSCTQANPYSSAQDAITWTHNNPDVDYYLDGTTIYQRTFDWTHPLNAPTVKTFVNLTTCPGLATLVETWHSPLTMSYDDERISVAFSDLGNQDTGEYAVTYYLPTGGCQVWNTLAQTIMGTPSFGATGVPTTSYAFTIHDMFIYPSGWATVSVGTTCTGCPSAHGPFLWQTSTLTVNLPTLDSSGHETAGYSHYLNLSSSPKAAFREFTDVGSVSFITSDTDVDFPFPQDTHVGWQNVNSLDSVPFWASQSSTGLSQPITITSPLEQEIWMGVRETGDFIRVAPTMTSGTTNGWNFRTEYAIGAMSPTGCIAWASDWEGTLGNTDGTTKTCKLGASPPNACRSDVFIVCPR